jgi:hypothetical protein
MNGKCKLVLVYCLHFTVSKNPVSIIVLTDKPNFFAQINHIMALRATIQIIRDKILVLFGDFIFKKIIVCYAIQAWNCEICLESNYILKLGLILFSKIIQIKAIL